MLEQMNRFDHGRTYVAIISHYDEGLNKAQIAQENIKAYSSRDALKVARRRADRKGYKTGEIRIVRGAPQVTAKWSPRKHPGKYVEDEVVYTKHETMNINLRQIENFKNHK